MRNLNAIGVSFINKEDLYPKKEQRNTWFPQATDPFDEPSRPSTTEYSMMINTKALEYLDDPQLTFLAARSPLQQQANAQKLQQANLSKYGLPEHQATHSTIDYLRKNQYFK